MSIPHQTAEHSPATVDDIDLWEGEPRTRDEQRPRERHSEFDRIPPQDLDAEQSVLGGMQLSRDAIEDVVIDVKLKPRDFYKPAHETIYRAICEMYGQGEPVDPITLAAELTKRGELSRVGGADYLHALVQTVPSAANAEWYAEIVKERAASRRMVEAGNRITQLGYAEGELSDRVNAAGAEVFQITDDNSEEDYALIGDGLEADIDAIEAISRRNGAMIGVPTGFIDLDALTGGFQEDQFIVVAGRPAMGKSTLALDFVRAAAIKNDMPVAVFSLEMGTREIRYRMLSAECSVALHHIRGGAMTEDDWNRFAQHQGRVKNAPIHLDASANLTLVDIQAKARRLVQRHGVKMLVIDYLQLIKSGASGGRREANRQEEVSDISRSLKLLAKELGIPVIGLSQLNRGPEQRQDKKPMISDLRESGAIEQDADIVILLHREDAYDKESPRAGEADLMVAKHRNGPTATVTVAFQGHYSRFVDMAQT